MFGRKCSEKSSRRSKSKLLGDDTGTATECIVGVTVLLDMRRNHQQRLARYIASQTDSKLAVVA